MNEVSETANGKAPALEIDFDVYMPLFEDESISDADKLELLEALWSIVVSFAQMGWGVHPVQQVCAMSANACGQIGDSAAGSLDQGRFVVKSDSTSVTGEFDSAADSLPQKVTSP